MDLNTYIVDAFTGEPFTGNPAGVCYLEEEIEDNILQKIAAEINLSETAFVTPTKSRGNNCFNIRWFTPKTEMPICGHATLAASEVLFREYNISDDSVIYDSKSGILKAFRYNSGIELDFPIDNVMKAECSTAVLNALGISTYKNIFIGEKTKKLVIHLDTPEEVYKLTPDFSKLKDIKVDFKGIGVTAQHNRYDFISRYFNPWAGVNEDPVTGSVHTVLGRYWSELLNKNVLYAHQASERSGDIRITIKENERLGFWGKSVIVLRGKFSIKSFD